MNKKQFTYTIHFLLLSNLAILSSSHANEPVNPSDSTNMISSSELSQCHEDSKVLDQRSEQLKAESQQLTTMKNELNQLHDDRNTQYTETDFKAQASVNKYNQLNNNLNHLSQQYSVEVKKFNENIKRYTNDTAELIARCHNKNYKKE